MTNAATNVAPTEANVASAGHLNLHQAACETAKSPVTLIVKEAQDGDSDAVWATTTQAPGVVERAHRMVYSLKERANYGRSVASFMAAGITSKYDAVRRAMANLPPKQQDSYF